MSTHLIRNLSLLLIGFSCHGLAAAEAPTPERVVLPANVNPLHYDLSIVPDAAHLTFRGEVNIQLDIKQPTRTIVLNAADLAFEGASLSGESTAPQITLQEPEQTATLTFPTTLAVGTRTLTLTYQGRIYEQASGFFALDYEVGGKSQRALFTQFENSDARRFVPSWDEPARKATFTLTATVPSTELAVANMPIVSTENLGNGFKRVHFARTPKMSTYLLFFGMGDFERAHRQVGNVDVGVIVKRGDTSRGQFALDAAVQLLPYYNEYFGTPYPLPKLDLISGPGSSQFFGAMENWGAVFFFDHDLLIDARISTQTDQQNVYSVIAHEIAHQWFGNLVTMQWWDDLWLNEGFASWMENKASDHFHPEWKIWLQSIGPVQATMKIDAAAGTHPIVTPIRDVFAAAGAFDDITYSKGQAVLRMLEDYVGEEAFRTGVRRYMEKYAYGNTVTDNFWHEIDAVSEKKITAVAHDFTLQAGVPLISASTTGCSDGKQHVTLEQSRFAVDAAGKAGPQRWRVPVELGVLGNPETYSAVVTGASPTSISVSGCGAVIVNARQVGYYRTSYAATQFSTIAAQLSRLSPEDQVGVLENTWALAAIGRAPMAHYLELTRRLPVSADPVAWLALADRLASLDRLYDDLPAQPAFRTYVQHILQPVLSQLTWDKHAGESDNTAILRSAVLVTLGRAEDPAVVAEARKRFSQFLDRPESIPAAIRKPMLQITAMHADATTWAQLQALAKSAPTQLEQHEYYSLLGAARDVKLAQRALDLALTTQLPTTLRPEIIRTVAQRHPQRAVEFTIAHWQTLQALLETDSRAQYVPRLIQNSKDIKALDTLNAFAKTHIHASSRGEVAKASAAIRYNVQLLPRLRDIDRWIAGS